MPRQLNISQDTIDIMKPDTHDYLNSIKVSYLTGWNKTIPTQLYCRWQDRTEGEMKNSKDCSVVLMVG